MNMKQLLNWRWWVLFALFFAGFLATWMMFGDDDMPMREWIKVRIALALIAVGCFYPMSRLLKKWVREGKIKIEEPD